MPDLFCDVDTALTKVPVNIMPLVDRTDFVTVETAVTYNASGLDLMWNFVRTDGTWTTTPVTPTTSGVHDWGGGGNGGMYYIEIPASGGTINNDQEGCGWFSGETDGVLPWRGPVICFRPAATNALLVDDTPTAARGLAGTALPNAAADAAGGLPISDAGGLDMDSLGGGGDWSTGEKEEIRYRLGIDGTTSTPATNDPNLGTVTANVTQFLGTTIVETTAGRIAANFDEFYDNDDSATSKTVDDVGGGTVSGVVQANVTQVMGTALTETTAGRLAANTSTILDNADAATAKTADDIGTATFSGTVAANVTQVLGTALTETTTGRIAGNTSTLLDNGDSASTKTQDDIGTATSPGTVDANVIQIKGTAVTETSAGNLADNVSQFFDLDTTTTKTVNDVDQATVAGTVNANLTQILGTSVTESSSGRIAANWDEFYDNDDAASAVTLQTIQDIDDGVDGGSGSGAHTVTINVKDTAGTPANLENASVRMTEGINTFVAQTDASGNAVFALDAATYSYAITKPGYTSETGSTVVSTTATFNYDIEQAAITQSAGSDTSTGVLVCYDENHDIESGVVFSMQMTAGPGLSGNALDTKVRTATSAVTTGLVEFTDLVRGATYNLWRSTFTTSSVFGSVATANAKVTVVVPDASSFNLPEVIGVDE